MRARTRNGIAGLALAAVTGGLWIFMFLPPRGWADVALGMPRSRVVALVGEPFSDSGDIKGCLWVRRRLLVEYRLRMFFDPSDHSIDVSIERRIGTRDRFHETHLRWESSSSLPE
jgi:hypothetical protein